MISQMQKEAKMNKLMNFTVNPMSDQKEMVVSGQRENQQKWVGPRQTRWDVTSLSAQLPQTVPPGKGSQGVQAYVVANSTPSHLDAHSLDAAHVS